jgi:excisionase family DNA binding protein
MSSAAIAEVFPDDSTRQKAAEASHKLSILLGSEDDTRVLVTSSGTKESKIEALLPPVAVALLVRALGELAQGNAVTMVPTHAELTTQQAADLLNVSRPFLVRLLEEGQIPYRRVGNRRRVLAEDLFAYRAKTDERTGRAVTELTGEAEELGLDY